MNRMFIGGKIKNAAAFIDCRKIYGGLPNFQKKSRIAMFAASFYGELNKNQSCQCSTVRAILQKHQQSLQLREFTPAHAKPIPVKFDIAFCDYLKDVRWFGCRAFFLHP